MLFTARKHTRMSLAGSVRGRLWLSDSQGPRGTRLRPAAGFHGPARRQGWRWHSNGVLQGQCWLHFHLLKEDVLDSEQQSQCQTDDLFDVHGDHPGGGEGEKDVRSNIMWHLDHVKDLKVRLSYLMSLIAHMWEQIASQLLYQVTSFTLNCNNLSDMEKRGCDTLLQ